MSFKINLEIRSKKEIFSKLNFNCKVFGIKISVTIVSIEEKS